MNSLEDNLLLEKNLGLNNDLNIYIYVYDLKRSEINNKNRKVFWGTFLNLQTLNRHELFSATNGVDRHQKCVD